MRLLLFLWMVVYLTYAVACPSLPGQWEGTFNIEEGRCKCTGTMIVEATARSASANLELFYLHVDCIQGCGCCHLSRLVGICRDEQLLLTSPDMDMHSITSLRGGMTSLCQFTGHVNVTHLNLECMAPGSQVLFSLHQ